MATPQRDIAIVGAGLMGRWHAATARRLGARVVAIVDPDPARASALAAHHGARVLADVAGLLEAPRPAVAHVCSPLASHAASCEALLGAGCHVICEKPLAATAVEVERLLGRAGAVGRSLLPVHQFASQRGVASVSRRAATLAPLSRVSIDICTAGADGGDSSRRNELLLDALPHPLSVLRTWWPDCSLAGLDWHVQHPQAGELLASADIAGATAVIGISCSARPPEASACLRGAGGTARVDFFHGYATFDGAAVSRGQKVLRPFAHSVRNVAAAGTNLLRRTVDWEPAYPGLRDFVRSCYRHFDGTGLPPVSVADVLDVYRARDIIRAAMRLES